MKIRSFALYVASAAFCFGSLLPAQSKRPMTFEDMMHVKRLGETAVSPDGKWLAYSVTTVNLEQNTKTAELWLQPIAGGEPHRIAVTQAGDRGPQFSKDGHSMLFLSGREHGQQVWIADFDTATGVTSHPRRMTNISTEADNAIWAPDGKFVVFTSFVYPDCPAIRPGDDGAGDRCNAEKDKAAAASKVKARIFTHLLYRHWNQYTGDKRSHLFEVSLEDGRLRDLTPEAKNDVPAFSLDGGGCGCAISPDSKELAFTFKDVPVEAVSTSSSVFTLDLTNPDAKPVKISTSAGGNFDPAYSPDGKYLAWRSQARAGYESDKFRLWLYDRAKGGKSAGQQASESAGRDLLPKWENWVDEFAWAPDSSFLYFVSGERGEEPVFATDLDGSMVRLWDGGEASDLHPLQKRGEWLASVMTVSKPSEIVHFNGDFSFCTGGECPGSGFSVSSVTHLNEALLDQLDQQRMIDFWFTAKDGVKVQGFLIPPPGFDAHKKYPVKFLIHGGPQGAWGDSWSYRWNAELFAANGYVVVMINPRGSTGYGQKFVEGVSGDWGGVPYTDLMTGLDYAEQHYPFIDKNRECALGASYGGYMANWILGHTDRFKCIVTHDGMFNAESAFGSTEEDWFNIWEFSGHPWDYYGKPDSENPFRKWSPSLYAKNFKTPTLVVHGQLDYRLDVSEGLQLFDTLQLLHVPSEMLYFPDEGHFVLKPQNSQLWYKTVNAWVDRWTAAAH
ncbi:MAG: S9 family peptidase [Acidobacteriota bacterium]